LPFTSIGLLDEQFALLHRPFLKELTPPGA
jgi:hypothetical protein